MARTCVNANSEYFITTSTPVSAAPLTMAGWFYSTDDSNNFLTMMSIADASSSVDYFALYTMGGVGGDPIRFTSRDSGGAVSANTSTGFTINTWHHAAAREVSSTSRNVRIDGGSEGTNTTDTTPAALDRLGFGSGVDVTPGDFLDGSLAEWGLWNVALTDAEISILALGYSPLLVRPQSLVLYNRFNRPSGDEFDLIGGLTLTDTNTVTAFDHPRMIYPYAPPVIAPPAVAGGTIARHLLQAYKGLQAA